MYIPGPPVKLSSTLMTAFYNQWIIAVVFELRIVPRHLCSHLRSSNFLVWGAVYNLGAYIICDGNKSTKMLVLKTFLPSKYVNVTDHTILDNRTTTAIQFGDQLTIYSVDKTFQTHLPTQL